MKKSIFCLMAAVLAVAACKEEGPDPNVVTGVSVVPAEVVLDEGDTKTLDVEVKPATAVVTSVTWSSDDSKVAKVSKKGLLTAVGEGSTTVYAEVDGIKGQCKVTVNKRVVEVSGISLDKSEATIGIGELLELNATVTPAEATSKTIDWTSSDKSVATVDANGIVKGVKDGEATITAAAGGKEAKCKVTVVNNNVVSIAFTGASAEAKVVEAGSQESIAVEFTPKNPNNKDLTWTSSNTELATVEASGDGLAKVTFSSTKFGAVTITAASKSNPAATASQSYFIKGTTPLYTKPEGTVYVGKKAEYKFNSSVYAGATSVKWSTGKKVVEGETAMLAVDESGENTIVLTVMFDDTRMEESFTVNAETWYMDIDLKGKGWGVNNTAPVFSPDGKKAYFVTQVANRSVVEIDLENRKLGWEYTIPASETTCNNGGHLAVNPKTGDIIVPCSSCVYCITSAGELKWKSVELETNHGRNPCLYSGCGAAFSNDCSVAFMCCTPRGLYAFNMADGTVIDMVNKWNIIDDGQAQNPESNQCQMAVYGDNEIAIHLKQYYAVFFKFENNQFVKTGDMKTSLAGSQYCTDMCSCAVTKDQKTLFFVGYSVESVDLTTRKYITDDQLSSTKWHMAPSITEDGHFYMPVGEYQGSSAAIIYTKAEPSLSSPVTAAFSSAVSGVDAFKFASAPCDRDGNAYFCFQDKTNNTMTFYKSEKGAPATAIGRAEGISDYQGAFNFGNGYLIALTGSNSKTGRLLVRCVDAERAHSWSGHGGDICSTKNANLVYAQ